MDDGETINIFEQEEKDYLQITLTDGRNLTIRQYNTFHSLWGIYSTVWMGGLALLRVLSDRLVLSSSSSSSSLSDSPNNNEKTTIIDIGSGTGIVGIGIAAATNGRVKTIVTDLPDALPLLEENCRINYHLWSKNKDGVNEMGDGSGGGGVLSQNPLVKELTWGRTIEATTTTTTAMTSNRYEWFPMSPGTVIITGADVVYRQSLFEPLLKSINNLMTFYSQKDDITCECYLACQSIRTHLEEFWCLARKNGFRVHLCSVVEFENEERQLDLREARCIDVGGGDGDLPSVTFQPRDGRIYIVRVEMMNETVGAN